MCNKRWACTCPCILFFYLGLFLPFLQSMRTVRQLQRSCKRACATLAKKNHSSPDIHEVEVHTVWSCETMRYWLWLDINTTRVALMIQSKSISHDLHMIKQCVPPPHEYLGWNNFFSARCCINYVLSFYFYVQDLMQVSLSLSLSLSLYFSFLSPADSANGFKINRQASD